MADYNLVKMEKKLRKELDSDRYHHTLGVMYTAASLAMCHGADLMATQVAGLLHDCAKCIPNDRKLKLCEKYSIPVTDTEKKAPYLLHAKLGAYLAKHKYDVQDADILNAITWHTTGRPNMSLLEKIIYIADYIEPMRWKAQRLPLIRKMAFEDLDRAVYMTLHDTLHYLEKGEHNSLDATTLQAYQFYAALMPGQEQ